jgi:ligand-binding sensor domain-containing protein/signal transduction histidine kinase
VIVGKSKNVHSLSSLTYIQIRISQRIDFYTSLRAKNPVCSGMKFWFVFLLLVSCFLRAQDPPFFHNTVENGSPSNEIYWLHQDYDGYIWIGCDAGLFKFNGVHYDQLSSSDLSARSATGIIQSKTTGRIYAYNFNRQLFYVENNRLRVVHSWNLPIYGLADDQQGNIWVTSSEGVFKLNEKSLSISKVNSKLHYKDNDGRSFSSHGISNPDGQIYYQCGNSLMNWKKNVPSLVKLDNRFLNVNLFLSRFSVYPWVFSYNGDRIMRYYKDKCVPYRNYRLLELLKGKKINCVFESRDGKIWIGTYSGLICHDPRKRTTELFYTQFSFSFGIEDSQGNYWFSTLHHGIIRLPNLQVRHWQTRDVNGLADQYNQLVFDGDHVFFGGTYGFLGSMNTGSLSFKKIEHLPDADFGMMYSDPIDQCAYFNKNGQIFRFKDGLFTLVNKSGRPIKSMLHTRSGYFFLSSQGLFRTKSISELLTEEKMIDQDWYREMCPSPFSSSYFAASNGGLVELGTLKGSLSIIKKHLSGKQILSISEDKTHRKIYILTFDGTLYYLDDKGKVHRILKIENDIRATQLRYHENKLFLASNKGIVIIHTDSYKLEVFDRLSGLNSNNVRALAIMNGYCWTAGDGVHRIPLSEFKLDTFKSRIRLVRVEKNNKKLPLTDLIQIDFDDEIDLFLDGMSFRSNDQFQFAYRIKGHTNSWIMVPGSLKSIDFSSLPTGTIDIEVKLTDHRGKDSENLIRLAFYVQPPFWQRWWFYVLIIGLVGLATYLFFKRRESTLRKKQLREIKNLRLENELRLTQQNALKAQMNPHFLFNVLNSIKGYIYENDKKNAARYLSDFSSLVRKVLELSSVQSVLLEQEIEALKLYIDLEAMLLQSDFEYTIVVDENVDTSGVKVPALLLQPFVENAFKHGLRHKTGPKRLKIEIRMDEADEVLTVSISDNGIGREASNLLNLQNRSDHQSFASVAMEKRIQLLNFEKKDVVGIEIRDNFEGPVPSGTTVIIRIHV